MSSLYQDVLRQRCELEQRVLKNALSIATQFPDEFAYNFMKGPGYMAVMAGEAVHIIKCIPVIIKIRHTTECYTQLPVEKENDAYFLLPKTHILVKTGTQISCNRILKNMYQIGDEWYKLNPTPERSIPPLEIKPMSKPTWKYSNPASLATNGIYQKEDLERLRDHIMFPVEKPAVLNTMARGATGQSFNRKDIDISNLLDRTTIKNMVKDLWTNLWSTFTIFGTASAGILGLYVTIKTIKSLIDILIHGYTLHRVYGWSLYLIGALLNSVTNLLLHLSRTDRTQDPPKGPSNDQQHMNHHQTPPEDPLPSREEVSIPISTQSPPIRPKSETLYPLVTTTISGKHNTPNPKSEPLYLLSSKGCNVCDT